MVLAECDKAVMIEILIFSTGSILPQIFQGCKMHEDKSHNMTKNQSLREEKMNTPTLETERLLLRKFTEKDLKAIYEIYSDRETNIFLPWFPLKTMEEAKTLYEQQYVRKYNRENGYNYAICFKEDNFPIGYVNTGTEASHDFGYGLRKEFWHRGIVTEAGKAVIGQLKKDGIPYITATHDVNNPRSGEVMKKRGYRQFFRSSKNNGRWHFK